MQKKQAFRSGLIAYLPQHNFLPPNIRVKEAINLYIQQDKREQFLDDKNLAYITESRAKELSGGELRYLEIKLILFCSAKYILLDGSFNGISPVCCESVREVHKIANRILLLDQGFLKEIKDKSEFVSYGYSNRD